MEYYPINLDIKNRKCLVVGGGAVGTRKVITLLKCGARVTVVSPELTDKLHKLATTGTIKWTSRPYTTSDLTDAFIVIGATDDNTLNQRIHLDAEKHHKLCNIADQPESCNFILPSIVSRGDLVITVSTNGKSPAYAKKLRQSLENRFGEENAVFLQLMGAIRERILSQNSLCKDHKPIFEKLVNSDILELIKDNNIRRINEQLAEILGNGYDFKTLLQAGDKIKPDN